MGLLKNIINFDELYNIIKKSWTGANKEEEPSRTYIQSLSGYKDPFIWQIPFDCIIDDIIIYGSREENFSLTDSIIIDINGYQLINNYITAEKKSFPLHYRGHKNTLLTVIPNTKLYRQIVIDIHYKQIIAKGVTE